jgi:hypothetical protein
MSSEEYSEAISHFWITKNLILDVYKNQGNSTENKNATLVARLTRAMLKMGLAYEKRNAIDLAYLTYSELVNILISNRFIDEKKFGLDYRLEKTPEWEGNKILLFHPRYGSASPQNEFDKIRPRFVTPREDYVTSWSYNDEIIDKLSYHLSEESSALITKLSIYEDLRVAYTPLLAKLFSIEKQNVGGITHTNIAVTESEFRHLFLLTNSKEKYILSADFFRKLGDILYYKNSDFKRDQKKLCELLDLWDYNLEKDITDFCYHKGTPKATAEKIIKQVKELDAEGLDQFTDKAYWMWKSRKFILWYYNTIRKVAKENNKSQKEIIESFLKSKEFNRLTRHYASTRIGAIADCYNRQGKSCYACKYYNRSLNILTERLKTIFCRDKDQRKSFHREF